MRISKFRRNKQIGYTFFIIAIVIAATLVLNAFKIGDIGVRTFQWIFLFTSLAFGIIELTSPFAIITANHLIYRESIFFQKRILIRNIIKTKSLNKRIVLLVITKENIKYAINLKSLFRDEKEIFISTIEKIAEENIKSS